MLVSKLNKCHCFVHSAEILTLGRRGREIICAEHWACSSTLSWNRVFVWLPLQRTVPGWGLWHFSISVNSVWHEIKPKPQWFRLKNSTRWEKRTMWDFNFPRRLWQGWNKQFIERGVLGCSSPRQALKCRTGSLIKCGWTSMPKKLLHWLSGHAPAPWHG